MTVHTDGVHRRRRCVDGAAAGTRSEADLDPLDRLVDLVLDLSGYGGDQSDRTILRHWAFERNLPTDRLARECFLPVRG